MKLTIATIYTHQNEVAATLAGTDSTRVSREAKATATAMIPPGGVSIWEDCEVDDKTILYRGLINNAQGKVSFGWSTKDKIADNHGKKILDRLTEVGPHQGTSQGNDADGWWWIDAHTARALAHA